MSLAARHSAPAVLGVENSVLGRKWRSRLDAAGEARALAIAQAYGYDDLLSRVLAGRGVTAETAADYLNPTLRALMPDPSTLQDMDAAVTRLADAVVARETIAIFGDYDVDGAASSALLIDFFAAARAPEPLLHIPDRILEGYGPNIEAIRDLRARGASLLITVDCGTTSHEALAEARSIGLDVIVLDHHQAPELLPDAIVVNPNRQDDLSGQGRLCAAGVVFLALAGLSRELRRRDFWTPEAPAPDLLAAVDLVALATVADVAALTGLNRAFVVRGLEVMRLRPKVGIRALIEAARIDGKLRPYHLGFMLGPRINAGGRIGDAALGARLMVEADPDRARRLAAELDRLNGERQVQEQAMLVEAETKAAAIFRASNNVSCLIVGDETWHPGIVGLLASRLKEKFRIPSFAIAFNDKIGTGSGRSLTGVDLGRAVRMAVDRGHAVKGGGHAMAAGVTIAAENLDAFTTFMHEQLDEHVSLARSENALTIDATITPRAVTAEAIARVEMAGPFGQGNPEPVFALSGQVIVDAALVGSDHVRVRLQSGDGARLNAISFRSAETELGQALLGGRGARFHLAARLSVGQFRGVERVDCHIVDAAPVR